MSKFPQTQGGNIAVTTSPSSVRIVHGGGARLQQRWDDEEQFSEMIGRLRRLEERATPEFADYMQRNLRQVAQRLSEKCLPIETEVNV